MEKLPANHGSFAVFIQTSTALHQHCDMTLIAALHRVKETASRCREGRGSRKVTNAVRWAGSRRAGLIWCDPGSPADGLRCRCAPRWRTSRFRSSQIRTSEAVSADSGS